MTANATMTPAQRAAYDEARMTHGQRQQAAQDWKTAQHAILAGLALLIAAVYLIEPLLMM